MEGKVSCSNEGINFRSSKPECSYSESMRKEGRDQVDSVFKKKCYGKVECDFPLDNIMFNSTCTSAFAPQDVVYFMQVACSSNAIYVFNDKEYEFKKSSVGLIIVFNDIVILVSLFLLIAFHKWNQDVIC